jgi:hypothetical protein
MAINGNSPLVLVQKYSNIVGRGKTENPEDIKINTLSLKDSIAQWKNIKDIKQVKNGMPIPFILHRDFGFVSLQEKLKLSANLNYEEGIKIQDKRQNSIEINLRARKDEPVAIAFVLLVQSLWQSMETYNYEISYFNDGLFIKQGHMGALSIENEPGGNMFNINISLDSGETILSYYLEKERKKGTNKETEINGTLSRILENVKP